MAEIVVSDKEEIDFKYNLKVYFGFLTKYKWAALVLVGLAFLIEQSRPGAKLRLQADHRQGHPLHGPPMASDPFQRFLLIVFAVLLGVTATRVLGRWIYLRNINLLESDLITDIKRYYFNHLLTLSHGFHTTHKTGSLISRLSRGSGAVETMTDMIIFQYVPLLFQLGMAGASIFHYSFKVGFIVFATAVVLYRLFLRHERTPTTGERPVQQHVRPGKGQHQRRFHQHRVDQVFRQGKGRAKPLPRP